MKKLIFQLLSILLFTSCEKQISENKLPEEFTSSIEKKEKNITICHFDSIAGTWSSIIIKERKLPEHEAHGDVLGNCSEAITIIYDQVWMAKNLDVSTYRNGDPIPQFTDFSEWGLASTNGTGGWCYYDNDPANGPIYGKIYNMAALRDPRGLAPAGWHIPTNEEWITLTSHFGYELAGGSLKAPGTIEDGTGLWHQPNSNEVFLDRSTFRGLPGGYRHNSNSSGSGSQFIDIGYTGNWWISNTLSGVNILRGATLHYDTGGYDYMSLISGWEGLSVRCIKD